MSLAHVFIPHSNNSYRARFLQLPGLLVLIAFVFLYQEAIDITGKIGVLGYASQIPPSEVIKLSNDKRLEAGLSPLSENPLLVEAARQKGLDMLEKDYWAHVSPDGVEPWYFFQSAGYEYRYAGENLARDFSSPVGAVEAWMASPTHRDNLLSDKYSEIGVAVVEGDLNGVETTLVVQLFGTQAGAASVPAAQTAQNVATQSAPTKPVVEKVETEIFPETQPSKPTNPNAITIDAIVLDSGVTLSAADEIRGVVISPLNLTKIVSITLASMFLVVLIIDSVITFKKGIVRSTGRSLAHVSFMGMIILVVLIAKAGQII